MTETPCDVVKSTGKLRLFFLIMSLVVLTFAAGYTAGPGEQVTLREYVETIIREHEKRQALEVKATVDALTLSRIELERRLEGLNELRQDVVKDRALFVRQDVFESKIKSMDTARQDLKEEVITIRTQIVTWMAAIGVFFILVQFGLNYFTRKRTGNGGDLTRK